MAENLNPQQRHLVEQKAWLLREKGMTIRRIVAEIAKPGEQGGIGITLSPSSVYEALKRQETALHAEFTEQAAEIRALHTAQLEYVQELAMDAWERSRLPAESTRTKRTGVKTDEGGSAADGSGDAASLLVVETVHDSRSQAGDPRFLAAAMAAMADIRAIWGIDAPKKQDVTSGGERFAVIGYEIVMPAGVDVPG